MLRNIRVDRPSLGKTAMLQGLAIGGAILNRFGPRPFAAVAKTIGWLSGRQQHCAAEIAPGLWFGFDLGDFYWNRLAYRGYEYEPELGRLLLGLREVPYTFVDCGANFGYWSLLVATPEYGGHRVLAVEASPRTLEGLRRNVAAAPGSIEVYANAIAESSGHRMQLYERGSHAGASLRQQWLGNDRPLSGTFDVETISIDDLVEKASPPIDGPIVLKLDVEGVEIEALKGASRTLLRDSLVIFEEYGEDRECRVAAFVLDELRMAVFFMTDDGKLEVIRSIERVRDLKKHPRRGYNLIAARKDTSLYQRLIRLLRA